MTAPPPQYDGGKTDVSLELERIRRSVEVGFTDLGGRLNLLLQRADQTDKALRERADESQELEKRVATLEQKVWMAAGGATILGAAAGIVAPLMLK